jgi:hypothetical protein
VYLASFLISGTHKNLLAKNAQTVNILTLPLANAFAKPKHLS